MTGTQRVFQDRATIELLERRQLMADVTQTATFSPLVRGGQQQTLEQFSPVGLQSLTITAALDVDVTVDEKLSSTGPAVRTAMQGAYTVVKVNGQYISLGDSEAKSLSWDGGTVEQTLTWDLADSESREILDFTPYVGDGTYTVNIPGTVLFNLYSASSSSGDLTSALSRSTVGSITVTATATYAEPAAFAVEDKPVSKPKHAKRMELVESL